MYHPDFPRYPAEASMDSPLDYASLDSQKLIDLRDPTYGYGPAMVPDSSASQWHDVQKHSEDLRQLNQPARGFNGTHHFPSRAPSQAKTPLPESGNTLFAGEWRHMKLKTDEIEKQNAALREQIRQLAQYQSVLMGQVRELGELPDQVRMIQGTFNQRLDENKKELRTEVGRIDRMVGAHEVIYKKFYGLLSRLSKHRTVGGHRECDLPAEGSL